MSTTPTHLDINSSAVPEVIEFITTKFISDSELYGQLTNLLKMIISKLYTDSLSHNNFCANLTTPNGLTPKLIQMFGVSDRQLSSAMEEIGFYRGHAMYNDLYYQTLAVVYYIGLRKNDSVLRLYALVLINVKVFNGRKYKYMPNGCQSNIADHLIANKLLKSHLFVRYQNPFNLLTQYTAPSMDSFYHDQILKYPSDPKRGLLVLLAQSWGRLNQIFNGTAQHYYNAWDNKSALQTSNLSNAQSVESLSGTRVNDMVSKTVKNMLNTNTDLTPNDLSYLKMPPYSVSNAFLSKVFEYLNNHDNEDDVKNIVEMYYNILNIDDEHKMHNINVVLTVDKISGIKEKLSSKHDLKGYIDSLLKNMFGNIMVTAGASTLLKLRKVLMLIMLLRCKKALTNNPNATFERVSIN